MTDPTARPAWVDGDPFMEAIAASVWEHCRTEGTSLVVDDPRNIAAAASAAVSSPPPNQTAHNRAALSAKLWQIAEQHIIAEWICCEPLEPRHHLCEKGYAALGMAKTLLVDSDPEKAWNPAAPLLDVVIALLPPTVDRAAEFELRGTAEIRAAALLEAADFVRGLLITRTSITTAGLEAELRRLAAEAQQQEPELDADPQPVSDEFVQQLATVKVREAATVDPAVCPRCKGDNREAFALCPSCAEADGRLLCPRCREDITDYAEDDHVFRTGDERPYCSGECVVVAHRAAEAQQQAEPIVTVHSAPNLSPAAAEALGALVDVAKRQAQQQPEAERPRCPHCQLPHDLEPGSVAVLACAAIRASIADRDDASGPGRVADEETDAETGEADR